MCRRYLVPAMAVVVAAWFSSCDFSVDKPDGECAGDSDCEVGHCDEEAGVCVDCLWDGHCGGAYCLLDQSVCVECYEDSHCPEGLCEPQTNMCVGCLEDGDCDTGVCDLSAHVCVGEECENDGQCNDDNQCTEDGCSGGFCLHVELADGEPCSDGEFCTTGDHCQAGECVHEEMDPTCVDVDADGFDALEDCNDEDPAVHPGAEEVCDEIDNNCDDQVDEGCEEPGCVDEGGSVAVVPDAPECCEGLGLIPCDAPGEDGECLACDGASFCTFCGDGECNDPENECNCPDDCEEEPPPDCFAEGESFVDFEYEDKCCPGLTPVSDCILEPDGSCACPKCPCYVCTYCGDGECGLGETECTCPEDCGEPAECSIDKECDDLEECTLDLCVDGKCLHEELPDCGGEYCWDDGMCMDGYYCQYPDGGCWAETGSCAMIPEGCFQLYDPVCGCDGVTYGNYCDMQAESQSMAHEGECDTECVPEGEWGSGFVPGPPMECCEGLSSIAVAEWDPAGMCMMASDVFICANCGNGVCESGWENPCNCPADCEDEDPDLGLCAATGGQWTNCGSGCDPWSCGTPVPWICPDVCISQCACPEGAGWDPVNGCVKCTCAQWFDSYKWALDQVTQCSSPSDCAELSGTSCGCTNNLVVNSDVDLTYFWMVAELMGAAGCSPFVSTCDCPAADGFVCEDGHCGWNYL